MAHRTASTPAGPLERIQEAASRWLEAFRRSDRFFKMRAGVVGSWVLVSLVSLWIACPSSGPTNSLGADVEVLRESFVGGEQILIRNESSDMWTDVIVTIDGGWRYLRPTVRPHDQLVLSMSHFRKGDQAAPRELRPRTLRIECRQGAYRFDLK
jgi:hypothetical protein